MKATKAIEMKATKAIQTKKNAIGTIIAIETKEIY